ncbi:MAG: class I SAM-dependent methyltransferase [Candidatus Moraniibacteriota bacterium]
MERILEKDEYTSPVSAEAYSDMVDKYKSMVHGGFVERILERADDGSKILDVCTGPGQVPIELVERGDFEITGLDVSREMLNVAERNAAARNVKEKIRFVRGSVEQNDLPKNSFDIVACFNAMHHFEDPIFLWQKLRALTKPGGSIFLEDLVRPSGWLIPLYVIVFGGFDREVRKQYRDSLLAALSRKEWMNLFASVKKNDPAILKTHFLTHMSIVMTGSSNAVKKNVEIGLGGNFFIRAIREIFYK